MHKTDKKCLCLFCINYVYNKMILNGEHAYVNIVASEYTFSIFTDVCVCVRVCVRVCVHVCGCVGGACVWVCHTSHKSMHLLFILLFLLVYS